METMKNNIIIKTPADAIKSYDDGRRSVTLCVPPCGDKHINEVIDTVYYEKGYYIPYHYADRGAETLLVLKGRVEVTLYGKVCECGEGDFVNILAHCPYSLKTLEDGTVIRGIYTDLNMSSMYKDMELLEKNALPCSKKADYISEVYNAEHSFFALTEPVDTVKVEKGTLPQITAKDFAIYEYNGWEGVNCKLKVGRWNLKRVKEIWQFEIDKGYQLQYFKPNKNERLYHVQTGKVKIEAFGETLFAEEGDLIHIPQYTPFALTAMSEKTVILDLNVSTRLFRMLEMLQLAQRDEPEKVADPEWMKWLLDMNGSFLTGFALVE